MRKDHIFFAVYQQQDGLAPRKNKSGHGQYGAGMTSANERRSRITRPDSILNRNWTTRSNQ
jgi:hypothetical protein